MKAVTLFFILTLSNLCIAGQRCDFKLSHIDDLYTTIAGVPIEARESDLKTINIREFYVESAKGKIKTILTINALVDGWRGEEEIYFSIYRKKTSPGSKKFDLLQEKVNLRGIEEKTIWFDFYKLDVNCVLT